MDERDLWMDKETDKVMKEYKSKLLDLGITPERIIVFSSHATGAFREDSDFDLLVIADGFEQMDLWERMMLLDRARIGITRPMEILGITQREADSLNAGSFIKEELLEEGLVAG